MTDYITTSVLRAAIKGLSAWETAGANNCVSRWKDLYVGVEWPANVAFRQFAEDNRFDTYETGNGELWSLDENFKASDMVRRLTSVVNAYVGDEDRLKTLGGAQAYTFLVDEGNSDVVTEAWEDKIKELEACQNSK